MKSEFSQSEQDDEGGSSEERAQSDIAEAQREEVSEGQGFDRGEDLDSSAPSVSRAEFDALQERYLRLAAEYENFRKRTDRERAEQRDRAQGQLLEKLLDVLDDLERLAGLSIEATTVETAVQGIRLVERKFARVLESVGLEQVPAMDQRFDPEQHEALMLTDTAEPEEDEMVSNVFQSGYRFRGILLRPARVQVKRLND